MKSTKDYSMFKRIGSNRPVDPHHVSHLVKSIREKNLLHLNPIAVNDKLEVIDGQHRLEAARILDVDIFYLIDNCVASQDISRLNSIKKSWNMNDYIRYYAEEGRHEFKELQKFIDNYPLMKMSCVLGLCSSGDSKSYAKYVREGSVDILNIKKAYMIAEMIVELFNMPGKEFVFDSRFGLALSKAVSATGFSFSTLKEKVQMQSRRFVSCQTIFEYLEMIEELYNYKSSKNIIKLT